LFLVSSLLFYSRSCCVPLFVPKDPPASLFSRYGKLGFTLLSWLFRLYYCYIILICLVCWCEHVNSVIELLGICCVFVHERTVVSTGFLAQASMSRLGEINRCSPKPLHASGRSGDPRLFWASKRLALARPFSLSEELGEAVWCLVVYWSWMIDTYLGMIVMMKNM